MAKFLDTQAISNELMKLIKEAKDKIILVSYSFKVNPQIQERLKTKSSLGNLSEIVIIYGKTELKQTDLNWMKEIQDIKIYEKINLHAKCYLNEEKAIICSMNLYDYSQQNNIEMGILISRSEDKVAYEELMEEILNIKLNGARKKIEELVKNENVIAKNISTNAIKDEQARTTKLTAPQKLNVQLLHKFREQCSKFEKIKADQILTDDQIQLIAIGERIDKNSLVHIISTKYASKYAFGIIKALGDASKYSIGVVTSTWYQADESKYDRVKLKTLQNGEEKWFDTTQELPQKDKLVAVKLNGSWYNEYFYLES